LCIKYNEKISRINTFFIKNIFIVKIMNLNYTHNMKRRVRLTEGDLHRIVKESIRKVISEMDGNPMGDPVGNPTVGQAQEPMYKEGDIVYWMYCYSGVFPNFYKVVKVGPKSIWVSSMESKHSNVTMGYGSYDAIPDENRVSSKVRRIALRPNGVAYVNYYGHKQALNVWGGNPINCMSD
jgi:hypothetical protein